MKKTLSLLILLTLFLTGCEQDVSPPLLTNPVPPSSSVSAPTQTQTPAPSPTQTPTRTQRPTNTPFPSETEMVLPTLVTITFAPLTDMTTTITLERDSDFLSELQRFNPEVDIEQLRAQGDIIEHPDRSITITLPKYQYDQAVALQRAQIEGMFGFLSDGEVLKFVKDIRWDEDFSHFVVEIDSGEGDDIVSALQYSIALSTSKYRSFVGEEFQLEIITIDAQTKEVIDVFTFPPTDQP